MKDKDLEMLKENAGEVANLLKSFTHPSRLLILCFLSQGEMTVGKLEEISGLSQSAVSQYLKRMELEGLVSHRVDGKFRYYKVKDERVSKLISELQKIFC